MNSRLKTVIDALNIDQENCDQMFTVSESEKAFVLWVSGRWRFPMASCRNPELCDELQRCNAITET